MSIPNRMHPELIDWLSHPHDAREILDKASREPALISDLLDVIESDPGTLKFSAEKNLRRLSAYEPERLIPYLDRMMPLIDHPNAFIQWGFMNTLANLALVDHDHLLESLIPIYLKKIHDPSMITAANAAKASAVFMLSYPEIKQDLLQQLLSVKDVVFLDKGNPSLECKNIMIGHVLDLIETYGYRFDAKDDLIAFASRHTDNPRHSVALRARRLLKHLT